MLHPTSHGSSVFRCSKAATRGALAGAFEARHGDANLDWHEFIVPTS
jgi:hypothetical protein